MSVEINPADEPSPRREERTSSSGNTATLAGVVSATVLAVLLVILGCVVVCVWRRRKLTRTREKLELNKHLKAAIWEGVNVEIMPVSVLRKATNNFAESNKVGEGGFGKVYKGVLPDGRLVAMKTSNQTGTEEVRRQFFTEVRILSQVNYRGLVNLVGCCLAPDLAALVLDYISQGTLAQHLRGNRRVERRLCKWKTRLKIAYQAAEALSYLHTQAHPPIYHRDVKSANILLDDNLQSSRFWHLQTG